MRSTLTVIIIALTLAVAPAAAETDLVVLGPTADAKVPGAVVEHVKTALAHAAVAPLGGKVIDTTCAADTTCLAAAGAELHVKRVVAVTVGGARGDTIVLMLVDVAAKELVARRELAFSERNVDKQIGPQLRNFLDQAPIERAKELFEQGNQHFSLGELEEALDAYKRAYRVKPLAAFLFNIAQCQRKLGQYKEAITMYQSYLVGVPGAENKALVESLITESTTALAEQHRLAEQHAADEARRETERLTLGKKRAEAEAVAAAERRKVEVARIEADRDRDKLYNKHPARRWTYLTGGVGAAALITGGVFVVLSRNAQASFDDAGCGDRTQLLMADAIAHCGDLADRGARDARLGNVLLAGGGALLAASLVVFVLDPGNLERPDGGGVRVMVAPGSVQAVIRW